MDIEVKELGLLGSVPRTLSGVAYPVRLRAARRHAQIAFNAPEADARGCFVRTPSPIKVPHDVRALFFIEIVVHAAAERIFVKCTVPTTSNFE